MIRMARVGIDLINELDDPDTFVRAVHVTGDLEYLGQGTDDDQRWFVTVADERTILHFGSSYGGNALLGKIAHGLRQAAYDGWALARVPLRAVHADRHHRPRDRQEVARRRRLPERVRQDQPGDDAARPTASASATTSTFYGDDIAWLWVARRRSALRHEPRVRRVRRRQGHQRADQPDRAASRSPRARRCCSPTSPTTTTPTRSGGRARRPTPPSDLTGWHDWKGELISDRVRARRLALGPPEQPVHDHAGQRPQHRRTTSRTRRASRSTRIIFGGRTSDREPLIRAITDLAEGVYDGLTLGAEATFAAEGVDGQLRYDPMSMRPFMSYAEGDYAAHWLRDRRRRDRPADLRPRQLVPERPRGRALPLARLPRQPAPAAVADAAARRGGHRPADAGRHPPDSRRSSTSTASRSPQQDLDRVLTIDTDRWREEMGFREEHLCAVRRPPRGDLGGAPAGGCGVAGGGRIMTHSPC